MHYHSNTASKVVTQGSSSEWRPILQDWRFIVGVMLIGLAFRLDLLVASDFVIDSDEAIVGLMAKHILEGQGVPVFYYGQPYMGSFEPLVVAALFWLFGVSSEVLRIVPLLFSVAVIGLVYGIGCSIGNRQVGRLAAIFCTVPPAALVEWSSKARGGFIETLFLGALALLLTTHWLRREGIALGGMMLISFILGFGWWTNNQIIYFFVPVGIAFLSKVFTLTRGRLFAFAQLGLLGGGSFVAGGFPFWVWNATNDFRSFGHLGGVAWGRLSEHLSGLFETALPIIFGAQRFWHDEPVFSGSLIVGWILWGGLAALLVIYRWRPILALFRLRLETRSPVEIPALMVIAGIAAFVLSKFGDLVQAPRYLLPLYVGLFPLAAWVIVRLYGRFRGIGVTLGCAVVLLNFSSTYVGGRSIPGEPIVYAGERVSHDHSELIEWLDSQGTRFVRTNYWIGYRLAFETEERVRFVMFRDPYQVRIPSYEEDGAVEPVRDVPFVLVPAQVPIVSEALRLTGYRWQEVRKSEYVVLHTIEKINPSEPEPIEVPRSIYEVRSNRNSEAVRFAVDNDVATRWGSSGAQRPGMNFEVVFQAPTTVEGVEWTAGKWFTDFPRKLKLDVELPSGEVREVLSPRQMASLVYLLGEGGVVPLRFSPTEVKRIMFTQLGSDPVFDWTIAELRVLGPPR